MTAAKNLIAGTIPEGALALHVILLGKTRSGKSSKLRLIVEHCLERGQPVGIIDPKGDWWGIKLSATGKSAGFPVVIFGGEHADVKINEHSGAAVAELVATGNRPFLIDLGGWMPSKRTKFFVDFASTFFLKTRGRRVLAIDEVHNFAPQGKVLDPESGKALHWANRLASEGGGKGITLLSASQRPQKVHKDYVTSHETLIACKVIHKLDRDAVKDWIDGCGDPEQGKDVFKTLGSLPKPEAWVWSPEIQFGPALVKFPMFKTYDSFKPQEAGDAAKLKGWASVDLDDVNAKMADVIKAAEANDPTALKAALAKKDAEIAALKREAATAKPAPADPNARQKQAEAAATARADAATIAKLKKGLEEAMKFIVNVNAANFFKTGDEPVDAAVIQKAVEVATAAAMQQIERRIETRNKEVDAIKTAAGKLIGRLKKIADEDVTINVDVTRNEPFTVAPAARPRLERTTTAPTDGSLSGPLQKIIDAIRWWNVFGIAEPNHQQVGFLAHYVPGSGTWNRYLGTLRASGLIAKSGPLTLTEEGLTVAREPAETPTGDVLRAAVIAKLDGPLQRIMAPILRDYPRGLSHDEVAAEANYMPGSGTWNRYLGSLRALEIIERGGDLRAQDWMFPR